MQGSSRGQKHFSTTILDSIFHLKSFNIAQDGFRMDEILTKHEIYRRKNIVPKIILQEITVNLFDRDSTGPINHIDYLPYLDDPSIRDLLEKYTSLNWVQKKLPFLKYYATKTLPIIGLSNLLHFDAGQETKTINGYLPIEKELQDSEIVKFFEQNPDGYIWDIEPDLVEKFELFLLNCKKQKIQLILINTPEYNIGRPIHKNGDEILTIIKDLARKHNVIYLDYSKDSICQEKKFFYGLTHLNKLGAEAFSYKMANDILELNFLSDLPLSTNHQSY